jgi:hypothetical protein
MLLDGLSTLRLIDCNIMLPSAQVHAEQLLISMKKLAASLEACKRTDVPVSSPFIRDIGEYEVAMRLLCYPTSANAEDICHRLLTSGWNVSELMTVWSSLSSPTRDISSSSQRESIVFSRLQKLVRYLLL